MARPKPIYKTIRHQHKDPVTGVTSYEYEQVQMKPSEIKETIMKANNWTADQYRRQYDIFKNKLRAYENFREAHGAEVKTQSPLEVLYKQAKTKLREGSAYQPSLEMKRIQSFSAVSITKGKKLARNLNSVYSKRRGELFAATTNRAFAGFVRDVTKAQAIVYGVPLTSDDDEVTINAITQGKDYEVIDGQIYVDGAPMWKEKPITDPVKQEEALKALAEHIHAKQRPNGEVESSGETFGSDPLGDDFDYSGWLD